jgi:two-component system chemotaxis sensor kinase CheA
MGITGFDEARLRRAFLEEAEELNQKLGDSLLALETARKDPALINEIFRLVHSLKSESALMGFQRLSELAHRMEDVLGKAREGKLEIDKTIMDRIFTGADLIAEMMAAISQGGSDHDFKTGTIMNDLAAAAGGQDAPAGVSAPHAPEGQKPGPHTFSLGGIERRQLAESRDRGETLYLLTFRVDDAEAMKFPRAYLVFSNLEQVASVVQVRPSMDGEPADDACYALMAVLLAATDEATLRDAAGVDQILDIGIERCDYAHYLEAPSLEHAATDSGAPAASAAAAAAAAAAQELPAQPIEEDASRRPAPVEKTSIRVDTRKLDDLWSLIAELVLHKSHIARLSEDVAKGADMHLVREELAESFDSLDKISGGMQQAMQDTRMIPISVIFSKFPRLVRDLSKKLGKPVELSLSGEDTEIDRGIVEALSDPLTHIIRNSLDHGIESPEERARAGKPQKGRISISARRQGGTIAIELADDGKGIDSARIREKAVAMGISGAQGASEARLLELVFLPGFSTKDVVTDLSGRGVGMDVVATRIRGDLKGDVVLRSEPGRGTQVTLVLPLTLTIVNALLVRGDTQLYAIPLTDLDSTAKIVASEIRGARGDERSAWMDEQIPVFSLGELFGSGRRPSEEYFAAVLRNADSRALLIVDELIEEREIVIKPIDDLLNPQRLFSGVAVLEDGRLLFILDTSFIRREHSSEEGP